MKKLVKEIKFIVFCTTLLILFTIPILNIIIVFRLVEKQTMLDNWLSYKSPLWVTNIKNLKITICNGCGYDTLAIISPVDLSWTDDADLRFLRTIPIKYIRIADAETLEVQLWNQRGRKQKRLDEIAKKYADGGNG